MKTRYKLANAHKIVDLIISKYLEKGSVCIDGTLGNGNDSLKIYKALDGDCKIYSFDIQDQAINQAKNLFRDNNVAEEKINIISDSNENVDQYVREDVDFFILNLGYLPKGDKTITTTYKSVGTFLEKTLKIMAPGAFGIIVFYPGHPAGMEEYIKISDYLSRLDQKHFNVIKIEQMNQKNQPPQVVMVERL